MKIDFRQGAAQRGWGTRNGPWQPEEQGDPSSRALILGSVAAPAELIHYLPDADGLVLRQPHALVAFGGWVDAGSGGTGGVRHLISSLKRRKLVEIDSEEFYNFNHTRPLVSIVDAGQSPVHWARAAVHADRLVHTNELERFVAAT